MRDRVVVCGVTLTRQMVENALAELNKPEPVIFNHFDRVTASKSGRTGIVLKGWTQANYARGVFLGGKITIVTSDDQSSTFLNDEECAKVWRTMA